MFVCSVCDRSLPNADRAKSRTVICLSCKSLQAKPTTSAELAALRVKVDTLRGEVDTLQVLVNDLLTTMSASPTYKCLSDRAIVLLTALDKDGTLAAKNRADVVAEARKQAEAEARKQAAEQAEALAAAKRSEAGRKGWKTAKERYPATHSLAALQAATTLQPIAPTIPAPAQPLQGDAEDAVPQDLAGLDLAQALALEGQPANPPAPAIQKVPQRDTGQKPGVVIPTLDMPEAHKATGSALPVDPKAVNLADVFSPEAKQRQIVDDDDVNF